MPHRVRPSIVAGLSIAASTRSGPPSAGSEPATRHEEVKMTHLATRKMLVLTAAIIALAVQPAEAGAATEHSFAGSCAIVGVAEVDHPVTMLPSPNHVVFRGRGTCSGTLDGKRLPTGGAPVALKSSGDKLTGCTGTLVPELTYAIRFVRQPGRPAIRGTAELTFVGRTMAAVVHGATGGIASATGTIQGGAELLEDCAAGRLQSIGISMDMLTITPLVSG